jgi:ParB family chromosome partitioning protein
MENSQFHNNAVFFIEVDKIKPNPFQPRHDFDEGKLQELSESIRMYGLLQPLTVTRKEIQTPEGGLTTEYELIAGERRLRASKILGLREIPALIRTEEDDDRVKLELAIIENLQREDLSPVDRARAFQKLANNFGFKHADIGKKVGRSREYVSNSIRLLALSDEILEALSAKKISEGHTRPLLMLNDRPEEQNVLFKEIMIKKMTVRDAERISRKIAYDKVRKVDKTFDPEIVELEQEVGDALGTRVHIEPKSVGGKIQIDYFSDDDLKNILKMIRSGKIDVAPDTEEKIEDTLNTENIESNIETPVNEEVSSEEPVHADFPEDDSMEEDLDEDLYSVKNFSL